MNKSSLTNMRWMAGLACLVMVLWGLPGCGESESGHNEAEDSHSSASEAGDHAHDEKESGEHGHDDAGAEHAHDDAGAEHAHGQEFVAPKTFAAAVHLIHESMEAIEEALAAKRLDDIHGETENITKVAKLVGQLALADGSGVSRDAVRDINVAGRELASASDKLHEVSDVGDGPKSQAEFERMKPLAQTLSQFAGPAGEHGHEGESDQHKH